MLLVYHKANLAIGYLVTTYADSYKDFIDAHPDLGCIETDETDVSAATHNIKGVDPVVWLVAKIPFDITVVGGHISGLPVGTIVSADGGFCTIDEEDAGELELTFETPGSYQVSFSHPDYLDKEITVEAVAA